MKKILLLGGSAQQIVAIKTAKRLGLYTILCDYLPDNPGQYHADKFYMESTTDKVKILEIARAENIDYVIAYASDPAAPTAAFVAEKMDLPTNPYKAVNTLCNKDLFRGFLSEHGFNVPSCVSFSEKENIKEGISALRFPIIIKPVDSSGSKGITVLESPQGLEKAIEYALSYSRCKRIIVEEFIQKKHPFLVGGDIFVSDGKVIQWGLMNCHRDPSVNPLVPVGKSFPPILDDEDLATVKSTIERLIKELGIQFGPMNVELIVDRENHVFPIDIGPRSGGNMIPDLLCLIFHCDVVEMCVRAAMGETVTQDGDTSNDCCYATYNLHSACKGVYESIEFSSEIEPYILKKVIYKKPGDKVNFFANAANAIGIVFMKFPGKEKMLEMMDHMNRYIQIKLKD